jgi:hypothetical protein
MEEVTLILRQCRSLQRQKFFRPRGKKAWPNIAALASYDDKSDPAEIRIVQPYLFKLIDRHGTVAPSRVGKQDAIAPDTAKDHEVIVAVGMDGHYGRRPLDQILERQFAVWQFK